MVNYRTLEVRGTNTTNLIYFLDRGLSERELAHVGFGIEQKHPDRTYFIIRVTQRNDDSGSPSWEQGTAYDGNLPVYYHERRPLELRDFYYLKIIDETETLRGNGRSLTEIIQNSGWIETRRETIDASMKLDKPIAKQPWTKALTPTSSP